MNSIRWSSHPTPVDIQLGGLIAGSEYKLQLLFYEQCCTRGFDVLVGGVNIVEEFSPQREHGGIAAPGMGAVITYTFTAGAAGTLSVSLAGIDASWPGERLVPQSMPLLQHHTHSFCLRQI